MLQMYCVVVPLATIMKDEYGVNNAAIAGLIYLASGGGTLLGSRISGPYADYTVRKWMEKRGYRRPEDRLRASLIGAGIVQPLSGRKSSRVRELWEQALTSLQSPMGGSSGATAAALRPSASCSSSTARACSCH